MRGLLYPRLSTLFLNSVGGGGEKGGGDTRTCLFSNPTLRRSGIEASQVWAWALSLSRSLEKNNDGILTANPLQKPRPFHERERVSMFEICVLITKKKAP